jgi:uncharacterized protein (DUF1778 family)
MRHSNIKDEIISLRTSKREKARLARVAAKRGQSVQPFVLDSALQRPDAVLERG